MWLSLSPALSLVLSISLIPRVLAQNVHAPSCSAVTGFGNAKNIIEFAVGESQLVAETVLQTLRDFSDRNKDKTTPMTYDDYVARYRIAGTIATYLGTAGNDPQAFMQRQQRWSEGLNKFTSDQWNIQGQNKPLIVCQNDDWFRNETTYVNTTTGATEQYMLNGQPSFRFKDNVNNAYLPIGFDMCNSFQFAFTFWSADMNGPVVMMCSKGLNFAKRIGLYNIGYNYRQDFSTAQWAGQWQRNIDAWGWTITGLLMHELWHALVWLDDIALTTPVPLNGIRSLLRKGYFFEGSTALLAQNPAGVINNVDSFNWLTVAIYMKATLWVGQWALPIGSNIPPQILQSLSSGSGTRRARRAIGAGRL